jgi:CRISPR-associated endonuclease/helicase Cas3
MSSLEESFANIFQRGSKPFQVAVATHILNGRNVILRAPTGSGKTFAALFPFLHTFTQEQATRSFPRQMIYSLPLRVLANSLAETARKQAILGQEIRIQTGEIPEDGQFLEGDQIYATYDQTLSSFLHFPFSLGAKQANVNAGGLISSYLVFDEVHLMEMHRALGTTAEILRWLNQTTPFLMMTATLTDSTVEWLCKSTGAVLVELTEDEHKAIPKSRRWLLEAGPINAEFIYKHHTGKTIVVVNQVARAQELYLALKAIQLASKGNDKLVTTQIELLHSRFMQDHRSSKSTKIMRWLGKEADTTDCILVATQVIEVGLDISCTQLHTEIAPANSLVQRAGRCARFGGTGEVHVYPVPDEPEPYLPYESSLSQATLDHFEKISLADVTGTPALVGYTEELAFVKAVHDNADRQSIAEFERDDRVRTIKQTILSDEGYRNYRLLVRDIDAVSVFLCRDPRAQKARPFTREAFSISRKTLAGALRKAKDSLQVFGWYPQEEKDNGLNDEATAWQTFYDWLPLTEEQIFKAPQIALNPLFAFYDEHLGLRLNEPGNWESKRISHQAQTERFGYHRETYEEHIRKVWLCYQHRFADKHRLDHVSRRLEETLSLPFGSVDLLIRLVIACHDAAKLTNDWQKQINAYQKDIGKKEAQQGEFLAHSDYDPNDPAHNEANKRYKRPCHAVEGAIITFDAVFASVLTDLPNTTRKLLAKAFINAIATHHSPRAIKCSAQTLAAGATHEITRVVQLITGHSFNASAIQKLRQETPEETIERLCPNPLNSAEESTYLLYLTLVRALRIADQHSFEEAL